MPEHEYSRRQHQDLFHDIDRKQAELDALRPIPPERMAKLNRKLRLDWNYHSNAMEGNTLTYAETRALILHDRYIGNKEGRFYREIEGHDDVIQSLETLVKDDTPLTQALIRQLHKHMLGEPYWSPAVTPDGQDTRKNIIPGEYKTTPNHVLQPNGELFRYAEPLEVNARMTDLLDWYRAETESQEMHPMEIAALFHYRFILVHPFDDGNGRLARILMNLILMRARYVPAIIRLEDKPQYIDALRHADAANDLAPFVQLVGQSVLRVLDLMVRGAKGQDIEDPEDFDKRLALIKQKLQNKEVYVEAPDTQKIRINLFDTVLKPLHEQLHATIHKLEDLFTDFRLQYAFGNEKLESGGGGSIPSKDYLSYNLHFGRAYTYYLSYDCIQFRNVVHPHSVGVVLKVEYLFPKFVVSFCLDEDSSNRYEHWQTLAFTELLNLPYAEVLNNPPSVEGWVQRISNELLDRLEQQTA
jgi:Fic family protein